MEDWRGWLGNNGMVINRYDLTRYLLAKQFILGF